MDTTSLDGMKRAELQNLAKKAGIKANKKTGHLISELKKYYAKSNNTEVNTTHSQGESDTNSSQTETCITTATDETATESEVETKPKVRRGCHGRKAAGRRKTRKVSDSEADTTADEEVLETQPPKAEPKQEVVEADTETPSPPKRTRAKRGRRGRKRAATPTPIKEATPAKIAKASPVQQKSVTPKPIIPAVGTKDTKPDTTTPPKAETSATAEKKTPQNENESVPKTRGSSTRKSARKAATPVLTNPKPTEVQATPEVADTKTTKPATRSSSGRKEPKRRSTFEIDPATGTPKPKSQKKVEAKAKTDTKKKEANVKRIHKKVEQQKPNQPSTRIPNQPSTRIPKPRYGKPAAKPLTPGTKNWAKIHASNMNKMESIDDYLERKRKRTENLCASVKRAKVIVQEAKAAMDTLKAHRTPPVKGKQGPKIVKPVARPGVNFMSPRPTTKSALKGTNKSLLKGRKSGATANFASPVFKGPASKTPAAPSTASKSVSFKVSKLQTPKPVMPGKTSCQKRVSTPGPNRTMPRSGRKSAGDAAEKRKSAGVAAEKRKSLMSSARKSIGDGAKQRKSVGGATTPFRFGSQTDAITPATKTTYDIKASLSKGLTYKPYTGKLKPLGDQNYHFAKPKSGVSNAKTHLKMHANVAKAKAELKRPKVTSLKERRAVAIKHRAGKRENNMMARRGIKM